MLSQVRSAAVALLSLTLLTGLLYPLVVTAAAKVAFPREAAGSVLESKGQIVGSSLLGQPFESPKYFWGRVSATAPAPYNAGASAGSNLGPTNPALADAVKNRVTALRSADPGNDKLVPVDLVTASGSGLDPHISPASALYQVPRVARVRSLDEVSVRELVLRHVEAPDLGILGEPRVNVLALNLALDELK